MKHKTLSVRDITIIGMLTAVLSVLSILQIPMPSGVPITLQTFAVALCGYILGVYRGILCVLLYLLLGLAGLPVFAGMSSGIGTLFGFTGGFLYAFPVLAGLCGIGARFYKKMPAMIFGILGLFIFHAVGAFHYSVVASCGFRQGILLVSLPYLAKDILSVIGACLVSGSVKKAFSRAGISL